MGLGFLRSLGPQSSALGSNPYPSTLTLCQSVLNFKKWNKIHWEFSSINIFIMINFIITIIMIIPACIYIFKVNNKNTERRCQSNSTLKTPEQRHWRCSDICIAKLLTLNRSRALFWCFYCWLSTSKCALVLQPFERLFSLLHSTFSWKKIIFSKIFMELLMENR